MNYKTFPVILEGAEADDGQALAYASGLDWSEFETDWQHQHAWHCNHIDTVNGVGVYYNFPCDYYFFTDEVTNEEEAL